MHYTFRYFFPLRKSALEENQHLYCYSLTRQEQFNDEREHDIFFGHYCVCVCFSYDSVASCYHFCRLIFFTSYKRKFLKN